MGIGLVGSALLATSFGGCVDGAGRGWGKLRVALGAALEVDGDRLDATGRWRTAHGYALADAEVTLTLGDLHVRAEAEGALPFDPADPPDGYSLCHGGHCHADDGSLPTYAEIAAEIAGGSGAAEVLHVEVGAEAAVSLAVAVTEVAVSRCGDTACDLDRVVLGGVELEVVAVRLRGRLFADAAGRRGQVPTAGLPLDVTLPVQLALPTVATLRFDRGEPYAQRASIRVVLAADLLDGLPLAGLAGLGPIPSEESLLAATRAAVLHAGRLDVRYDAEAE